MSRVSRLLFTSKLAKYLALLSIIAVMAAGQARAATTYATWIMIWHGRDQGWWKADQGPQDLVNGEWKALDWVDEAQVEAHLEGIKKAGVTVVIADLTNGWKWLDKRCLLIQSVCAKKGLKFCIAENSTGDTAKFESHARDIWEKFAGPEAPYHDTYFNYHGKPLIVCYALRSWFKGYSDSTSEFRSHFNLVWTSGEDSNVDKWGWQLEPWVGSIPSKDSMFVTSAIKWKPGGDPIMWRKSLAWLDYNFTRASKSKPAYVVVGSYDDPTERNGWLISDTSGCQLGLQTRDQTGALSKTAYYDRVKQWISGKPSFVSGGLLRDGAYRIAVKSGGSFLGVLAAKDQDRGTPKAAIGATAQGKGTCGLFWFYHLGNNHYRIIILESGLALEARTAEDGPRVIQNWENDGKAQRWTLARVKRDSYRLINDSTGQALALEAASPAAALCPPNSASEQQWTIVPE